MDDQIPFVIISLFFTCVALSAIFVMAYRAFGWPKHALTWSFTFGLASVQWAFNIAYSFQVMTNFYLYWTIVNFIGPLVPAIAIIGYRQRAGKYLNIPLLAGFVLTSFGGTLWFTFVDPHVGLRTAILPYVTALMSVWVAWIIYDVPRPKRSVEWGLFIGYLLLFAAEVLIGTLALSSGVDYDQERMNQYRYVLFMVMPTAFTVSGMFALSIIASDLAKTATDLADFQERKRKEEAERSWGTLQDAIEAIPDLIAIDDGQGNLVTCNDAFAKLIGYPAEELKGRQTIELLEVYWRRLETIDGETVLSGEAFASKLWHALNSGERLNVQTKDDRSFIVDCSYVQNGGLILVARDVTPINNARVRLETAIHSIPIAFALFDKTNRLVACNKGYEEMVGENQEWIARQPLEKVVAAFLRRLMLAQNETLVVRSGWLDDALESVARREVSRNVVQLVDGSWYEIVTQPVAEGGFVTTASNITTRHMLEKDLEKNEAQLREILEGQPFPVMVMRHADSKVLFASDAAIEAIASEARSLPSKEARGFINQNPGILGPIFAAANSSHAGIQEVQLTRMDGASFPTLFSSQTIKYSGAEATAVSFIDMSNVKHLESELAAQQEALFQSEKLNALGTLLAGVAHELNNPLTVVVANAHVLSLATEDAKVQSRIEKITNAADRCSKIVRSFLDLARKSSGDKQEFDLTECVEKALELSIFGLKDQSIDVKTDFAANLPAVEGDGDQIGQVVMNLFINAKYALIDIEGLREIRVTCKLSDKGDMVELHVADNGPGVPEDIRDRIFDPFFTTKSVGQGTGMGLSLVHGIVQSHGGTIDLLKDTEGAHFRVRLPHLGTVIEKPGIDAKSEEPTKKRRLLVVDDEQDVLEALADILVIQGHEVTAVQSGQAALTELRKGPFDGLLSDLRMPEIDGPQLYREIEETFPEMAERTAFVTGDDLSTDARKFLETCGRPSLRKPFLPDQVASLLEDLGLT